MKNLGKSMSTGCGLRSWAIVSVTAIVVLVTLGMWRFFPIYPDEIFYRALVSRSLFDGFERTQVWPFCGGPGQTVPVPYIFFPAATIFAGGSLIENLSYNRRIAAVVMVISFSILWFALKRLASEERKIDPIPPWTCATVPTMIFCSAVLLCCLGTLPATLMMVRGESGIYILVAALVLSFTNWKAPLSRTSLLAGFILLVFTMSLFQHPKTLYFLPAVAVSMIALLWNRSALVCIAALSCLMLAGTEGYWINKVQFLSCPGSPSYEALARSYNVDVLKLISNPISFVGDVFQNIGPDRLWNIARKSMFVDKYDVNYLPPVQNSVMVEIANGVIGICWIILILVSASVVTLYLYKIADNLFASPKMPQPREKLADLVGMLALYTGVAVQISLNKTAWFYDCSYWLWLLIFLAAPSLLRALNVELTAGKFLREVAAAGVFFILFSSILSTALSAETFYQAFKSGFSGPGIPIVTLDPAATKLSVERALAQCEISPTSPRLMVDDITYPFVQTSYKTIAVSYAIALTSVQEAVSRAKALGSSGMIFRCSNATLFPDLSFKNAGGICCTKFSR
jgi:hypothetical protein